MKFAHTVEEMPKSAHFAILTFGSRWTEPYEAHETGSSSPAVEYYEWTLDRTEWEKECLKRAEGKYGDFIPLEVKPKQIVKTFTIE